MSVTRSNTSTKNRLTMRAFGWTRSAVYISARYLERLESIDVSCTLSDRLTPKGLISSMLYIYTVYLGRHYGYQQQN